MTQGIDGEAELHRLEKRRQEIIDGNIAREEKMNQQIQEVTDQNYQLRRHIKALDRNIKSLSLLHSQLTAASSYRLGKADVEEIIRLLSSI